MAKANKVELEKKILKSDRREGDRRKEGIPAAEMRKPERRKVQRRRQIDPTTCERDYKDDEIEFMQALDAYKRSSGRMFPTCSEILEVIRGMGYVRVSPILANPTIDMPAAIEPTPELATADSETL